MTRLTLAAWVAILVLGLGASAQAQLFNVMVTDDDGVGAEWIDALKKAQRDDVPRAALSTFSDAFA